MSLQVMHFLFQILLMQPENGIHDPHCVPYLLNGFIPDCNAAK